MRLLSTPSHAKVHYQHNRSLCFQPATLSRSIAASGDSKWLLTAGADSSVRLWDVERGIELYRWETHQPAKACAFAVADQRLAAFTTSTFATSMPTIRFVRLADIPSDNVQNPILQIDLERTQTCALQSSTAFCIASSRSFHQFISRLLFPRAACPLLHTRGEKAFTIEHAQHTMLPYHVWVGCRVSRVLFTDQDSVLVTVGEDGFARRYDVESGKLLLEEQVHTEMVTDMQVSTCCFFFCSIRVYGRDTCPSSAMPNLSCWRPVNTAVYRGNSIMYLRYCEQHDLDHHGKRMEC